MKTILRFTSLVVLAFLLMFSISVRAQNNPLSPTYGQDVLLYGVTGAIINNTEVVVAQNGWIYVLIQVTAISGNSAWQIYRSTDGGVTFGDFICNGSYSSADYSLTSIDLVVTGTTPADIRLWVAAALNEGSSGANVPSCLVTKFDVNGNNLGVPFQKSDATITKYYSISIATDFRSPGSGSQPFSIAFAFTGHSVLGDVLFYICSLDGGVSWTENGLAGVPGEDKVGKVSLALGRTKALEWGYYAVAFETNKTGNLGDIGIMMNYTNNGGFTWTTPTLVNHTHPNVIGKARNPSIILMDNAVANPTNIAVIPLIVAYEDWSSGPVDIMYNSLNEFYVWHTQPNLTDFSANWIGTNNNVDDMEPNLSFDKTYNNFVLTYYTADGNKLQSNWIGIEGILSGNWATPFNYRDATTSFLFLPFPKVDINLTKALTCFSWIDYEPSDGSQRVYFDSQWSSVGIPEPVSASASFSLQPNPAADKITINFKTSGNYEVMISSLMGQAILRQTLIERSNTINIEKLDAGIYFIRVSGQGMDETQKLVVR
jgi:hypothetical protein